VPINISLPPGRLCCLLALLAVVGPAQAFTHYDEASCEIIGDTDVYGIGVRLSYYLSYVAIVLAIASGNKKSIRECVKGLNVITLAILIILILNATKGSFAVFEWLLVFPMVLLPSAGVMFLFDWETCVTSACFGIVYGLFCLLQPWLYWILLEQGVKPGCDPKYFIFVYFDLYNPTYVRFLRAMSIVACIAGVAIFVCSIVTVVYGVFTPAEKLRRRDEDHNNIMNTIGLGRGTELSDESLRGAMKIAMALTAIPLSAGGIISIVFTEKLLSGNDVNLSDASLKDTSQLIPFLVGLFTLVSTIFSSFKDRD